jgi:hypothetical protein
MERDEDGVFDYESVHGSLLGASNWLDGIILHSNGITARLIGACSSRSDTIFVQCHCQVNACCELPLKAPLGMEPTSCQALHHFLGHANADVDIPDEEVSPELADTYDAMCRSRITVTTPSIKSPVSARGAVLDASLHVTTTGTPPSPPRCLSHVARWRS